MILGRQIESHFIDLGLFETPVRGRDFGNQGAKPMKAQIALGDYFNETKERL